MIYIDQYCLSFVFYFMGHIISQQQQPHLPFRSSGTLLRLLPTFTCSFVYLKGSWFETDKGWRRGKRGEFDTDYRLLFCLIFPIVFLSSLFSDSILWRLLSSYLISSYKVSKTPICISSRSLSSSFSLVNLLLEFWSSFYKFYAYDIFLYIKNSLKVLSCEATRMLSLP